MRERTSTTPIESSTVCYATREQWARGQIQAQLQQILEEEVSTFLSRARQARRERVSPVAPPRATGTGTASPGSLRC